MGVLKTSWGNEVNEFAQIHLITHVKFENDPKQNHTCSNTKSASMYTAAGKQIYLQ